MIEHLEENHQSLLEEQKELRKREDAGEVGLLKKFAAEKAKPFVNQCVDESEEIPFVRERQRLLGIIDYWGQLVYEETGEFTPSSLKPSSIGLTWIGMTWEKLRDACRGRARTFLQDRTREEIFAPEWAILREDVERQIQQFLESDRLAMVLTGEAGVGKTFLLCQMAQKSLEEEIQLILPYDSQDLVRRMRQLQPEPERRLSDVIGQIIANDLGYGDAAALEKELDYVADLLEGQGAYLLICFDSVERFGFDGQTAEHLLVAINTLVERFIAGRDKMRRVRFMMTCLDFSWDWLGAENLLSPSLYFFQEVERIRGVRIAWVMEEFNGVEFKEAYRNYIGQAPEGSQFENVRSICQGNPYLLRIVAALVRQNVQITKQEVFNEFYDTRVRRGSSDDQIRKERFLAKFMQNYDEELSGVPAIKVDTTDPAYAMLSLDGILAQKMKKNTFTRIILKLKPDGLAEHLRERFKGEEKDRGPG